MHEIQLEKELCITTLKTLTVLFSEECGSDAVALYFFYYKQCKLQQTNQSWCNKSYCLKGLGRGEIRFDKAKAILKKYNMVDDVKDIDEITGQIKKRYIKLNYFNIENPLPPETTPVADHPSGNDPLNAYKTKEVLNKEKKLRCDGLESFIKQWNGIPKFGYAKKGLPKVIKITDEIIKIRDKCIKQYTVEEIMIGATNYVQYMSKVKPSEGSTYFEHRFNLTSFLKQENGLSKFINNQM